ncbi:MAG: DUF4126 family protein [Longimicrobiales bacterium]
MTLLLSFLIGCLAGLRSFTAPAVTAWAARLGWLSLERPLALIGSIPAVVILTAIAMVELIADKSPTMPNRTERRGLAARIATGGITGACVAMAGAQPALVGAVLGSLGGVVGCFGGFQLRTRLVKALHTPDIVVALAEDVIAMVGCWWIVSRF